MGIQSGSKKILDFYNRPTSKEKIISSATLLADAARKYKMIPPAYDIISDNSIETKDDICESLSLIYRLARPFTLTIFSLRIFPKTKLWEYFSRNPQIDIRHNTTSYLRTQPTLANITLYLLAIFRPPKILFNWLLRHIHGNNETQPRYPLLHVSIKALYLFSRGIAHLQRRDFSNMNGIWLVVWYNCHLASLKFKRMLQKAIRKEPLPL